MVKFRHPRVLKGRNGEGLEDEGLVVKEEGKFQGGRLMDWLLPNCVVDRVQLTTEVC